MCRANEMLQHVIENNDVFDGLKTKQQQLDVANKVMVFDRLKSSTGSYERPAWARWHLAGDEKAAIEGALYK